MNGCFGGNNCIWIILCLMCCCGDDYGDNNCLWIILLLLCCCGNNGGGLLGGNGCGCGN